MRSASFRNFRCWASGAQRPGAAVPGVSSSKTGRFTTLSEFAGMPVIWDCASVLRRTADYFCGARYAGPDVPGFDRTELPEGLWLKFFAEGRISAGVLGEPWKRIYGEFMPQSEYCQIDLPTIERYVRWDEAADDCLVEILIPVKRS